MGTLAQAPGADPGIEARFGFSMGALAALIQGGIASLDRGTLKCAQLRMHGESVGRRRPTDAVGTALPAFPQTPQAGFAPGAAYSWAIARKLAPLLPLDGGEGRREEGSWSPPPPQPLGKLRFPHTPIQSSDPLRGILLHCFVGVAVVLPSRP